MPQISKANPKPLYMQLEELIKAKIESAEWEPQTMIPSEAELQRLYGVSRITIRSACANLIQEGLLYRVPGKGTFVSDLKITTQSLAYAGFREQLERMGYETETKLISLEHIFADKHIAKKLNILDESPVLKITRLRFMQNMPISLHYSYIPDRYQLKFSEKELEEEQLCILLEKQASLQPKKIVETLESSSATQDEAELFQIDEGHPIMILEDFLSDISENIYEYSKVVFRGDQIKLRYEFTK